MKRKRTQRNVEFVPASTPRAWYIYIPEEGHWPIKYNGEHARAARRIYLRWARRTRLPAGAIISRF